MSEAPERIWAHRWDTYATEPDGENLVEYVRADLIEEQAALLREAGELLVEVGGTLNGVGKLLKEPGLVEISEKARAFLAKLEARNA